MLAHLYEFVHPFIHAPRPVSPTSRRDAAVALITCVLVVIIGSLSNPIFVTVDLGLTFNLPCRQVPANMPHDDKLLAMQDEASKAGIPGFGKVLTAAVFEDLQVFVMPLLHMSQEVFIC
jgi:hypothetical protein